MTNQEFNDHFKKRLMQFVVNIFKLLESLPGTAAFNVITYQLSKSATSVGSNHRAFCRSRSQKERFSKISIVVEEADETEYWLDVLLNLGAGDKVLLAILVPESLEILKIVSSIKNSLYSNNKNP